MVSDQRIVTAQDTVNTPVFLRSLCKQFQEGFQPERKGILKGKKILIVAGEDFDDVELVASVMAYLYRGADVKLATFPPPQQEDRTWNREQVRLELPKTLHVSRLSDWNRAYKFSLIVLAVVPFRSGSREVGMDPASLN